MIKITSKGFKGNGVYIGRNKYGNVFGNPFPVKRSKFSEKVYSLRESLELYRKYFEEKVIKSREFKELVERYKTEGYLELDCWCINKTVRNIEDVDLNNCMCHGEIIAYYILKEC
ncbi:MAG: hypothetical protein DSY42_01155 [Aquifex sp.]|nr:MAG: hypothetical protein DSY42_01155 [Aquifex sp.]